MFVTVNFIVYSINNNLVQFLNQDFFKTIRNKLLWGADKRN